MLRRHVATNITTCDRGFYKVVGNFQTLPLHDKKAQHYLCSIITYWWPFRSRFGESEERSKKNKEKKSGLALLIATFMHLRKPYQILIVPLTVWSGMEQGFFFSDFTAVRSERNIKMSHFIIRYLLNSYMLFSIWLYRVMLLAPLAFTMSAGSSSPMVSLMQSAPSGRKHIISSRKTSTVVTHKLEI